MGHFHINATDKVGVGHSIWRWEVYPLGNSLPPSFPPSLSLLLSLELHMTPIVLILFPSSGEWNPRSLFTHSGMDYASYSLVRSSSVLGPQKKQLKDIWTLNFEFIKSTFAFFFFFFFFLKMRYAFLSRHKICLSISCNFNIYI